VDTARAAYEEALALAEKMGSLPAQVELHASLAQLAVYGADWEKVGRSTEASAELAEREGLVGKLCLPTALRGLLRWREGNLDESTVLFHRAHELAEQVGWSELAFQALFGLATALRDSGDLAGAQVALDRALDVCERAGLIAQSIQATAARAVILSLAHRREAAVEAAQEASELAERLHYPIGRAAALEAQGMCAEDAGAGAELLSQAAEAWGELDRPLEAARARLLAGQVLVSVDADRGREILVGAAEEIDRLGVRHLSQRARDLATS
jgi:tetratricopeptide (TPR) repeat protein